MCESGKKQEWEIVAHRLQQWKTYSRAPVCQICRARNSYYDPHKKDIRITPIGDVCLPCWLDRETCEVCGVGPVVPGDSWSRALKFQGNKVCYDCLVPDVPMDAWKDWLLYFCYTPKSSFVAILEDALAEDVRRRVDRVQSTHVSVRSIKEWPLIDALV